MTLFSAILFALLTVPVTPQVAQVPTTKEQVIEQKSYSYEGIASYYSRAGCLGCSKNLLMANGEPLDDSRLTLALIPSEYHLHKNHFVDVTNMVNGHSVKAKVTDSGGFGKLGRIADLSLATKNLLGCSNLCKVKITFYE